VGIGVDVDTNRVPASTQGFYPNPDASSRQRLFGTPGEIRPDDEQDPTIVDTLTDWDTRRLDGASPSRRQRVIDGRVRSLQRQIENFKKLLDACEKRHGMK